MRFSLLEIRELACLGLLAVLTVLSACSAGPTASPTPSLAASPTLTPSPSPTLTPSATPRPTATSTPTPTQTYTATFTPWPALPAAQATQVPQPAKAISPADVAGLRELARWGRGQAEEVEYSPDGQWLVVKTGQGSYVYPALNPAKGQYFEGSLHFSGKAQSAVSVSGSGRVELWQVDGWKLLAGLPGIQAAFAPDGSLLAVVDASGVQLLQTGDGKVRQSLVQKKVERSFFSPDGALLFALERESLQIWQVSHAKAVKSLEYERLLRAAQTRDGSLLLVQAHTKQNEPVIDVYKTADGSLLVSIPASGTMLLPPDGARLFVYTNFPTIGKIEIFSLPDGQPVGEIRAGGSIYRLTASPDNQTLAASIVDFSASNQQTVGYLKTFDRSGKVLQRLDCGIYCEPQVPVFSPDGKLIAVKGVSSANGLYIGSIFLFDPRTAERVRSLRGPKAVAGSIEKVAFAPNGETLVTLTGRVDNAVRVWKVSDGSVLHTMEWGPETLNLGSLAPDGKLLSVYTDTGVTQLLDVKNGSVSARIEKASEGRYSPRGEWLAVSDVSGVRLLKAPGGEVLTTFPKTLSGPMIFSPVEDLGAFLKDFSVQLVKLPAGGFSGTLNATGKPNVRLTVGAFSPDGKLLAAGSIYGEVWLWSMTDKKQLFILEGHKINVTGLRFSKDGSLLLSGSSDGNVRLWSVSDGKLVKTLNTNHLVRRSPSFDESGFGQLTSLTLSPDGNLLAVSGYLNPLQPAPARAGVTLLIRLDDGALQRILPGGGGYSAFSADGKIFYSSGDGAVHPWGILP